MGINDDGRRRAIRAAMEAAGHLEEDILDAIASLGLKGGGIVGLKHGGRIGFKKGGWDPGAGRDTRGYQTSHPSHGGGGGWDPGAGGTQHIPKKKTVVTGGDGIINTKKVTANPNLDFGVNIGKGLSGVDLAKLFNNYYKLSNLDSDTNPNTWDYNPTSPITTPNVAVDDVTVTTPDSTLNEVTETVTDKSFLDNIRDIKNRTQNQLIELGIAGELKDGGRIGLYQGGGEFEAPDFMNMSEVVENVNGDIVEEENITEANASNRIKQLYEQIEAGVNVNESKTELFQRFNINLFNTGGRVNKNTGGMMSVLPKGREMDYRGGGVIPMGSKERADDVPARLSKNEFVMTADAVKAAGGGSVNKGAKRMYNLMHKLEARV